MALKPFLHIFSERMKIISDTVLSLLFFWLSRTHWCILILQLKTYSRWQPRTFIMKLVHHSFQSFHQKFNLSLARTCIVMLNYHSPANLSYISQIMAAQIVSQICILLGSLYQRSSLVKCFTVLNWLKRQWKLSADLKEISRPISCPVGLKRFAVESRFYENDKSQFKFRGTDADQNFILPTNINAETDHQ